MPVRRHLTFYANASTSSGAGHIMRLFALAQSAKSEGHQVSFISKECPTWLQKKLRQALFKVYIKDDALGFIKTLNPDVLIVDDYNISAAQWRYIRELGCLRVIIDDYQNNDAIIADLIINPAPQFTAASYYPRNKTANLCLGPSYTLLRQEFVHQVPRAFETRHSIMLSMGGSDVKGLTLPLTTLLVRSFPDTEFNIVVGGLQTSSLACLTALATKHQNINILVNSNNMAEIMADAGLAITAAGGTLGELAAMGVPTIALVCVDNQLGALSSPLAGTWYEVIDLRKYKNEPKKSAETDPMLLQVIKMVDNLWHDKCSVSKRKYMSETARQIVDTKGCKRIIKTMLQALDLRS